MLTCVFSRQQWSSKHMQHYQRFLFTVLIKFSCLPHKFEHQLAYNYICNSNVTNYAVASGTLWKVKNCIFFKSVWCVCSGKLKNAPTVSCSSVFVLQLQKWQMVCLLNLCTEFVLALGTTVLDGSHEVFMHFCDCDPLNISYTWVISEVLCLVAALCSASNDWTQITRVTLVALLLLSQRCTVFVMSSAV